MTSLDELELRILGNARAHIEPNAADEGRVFSQLATHLGLGGAITASQVTAVKPGAIDRIRQVAQSRVALALSCALLGAGVGYALGLRAGNEARPPAAVLTTTATASVTRLPAPVEMGAATPAHVVSADPPTAPAEASARRHSMASEHGGNAARGSAEDPVAEELALLKRAERAIRANNPLLALGLLRELDQRFPKGVLLDERTAARTMASCQSSDPETARRTGEAYLRTAKNRIYHDRVRQLCHLSDPNEKESSTSGD